MALSLPDPIATYFAAKNAHDLEAMLAPFADDAQVHDEGRAYRGRDAIGGWMRETTRKYRVTATPEELNRESDAYVVRALVAGDFAGSPAYLTYRFSLAGSAITALSIG